MSGNVITGFKEDNSLREESNLPQFLVCVTNSNLVIETDGIAIILLLNYLQGF